MSINAIDIMIYGGIFFLAFSLSMLLLGEISRFMVKEFSKQFDQQIERYKKHTSDALNAHLDNINSALHFKNEINERFESLHEDLILLHRKLKSLNELCQNREELEKEILKLKNILKRKEKNK